jgi:predicted transcriptional regulator of viral defense system
MKRQEQRLGQLQMQLFAWCQLKNRYRIRTGDLLEPLGLTQGQERKLLSRMTRNGLIIRLKRGLYIVPPKLPPGGRWQAQEYVIVAELMKDAAAAYQLGGPTAFHFHGLSEQVPNRLYIYNDKISEERLIGGLAFQLIKVPAKRLGDTQNIILPDASFVKIATLPRSLLDAVYDWSRYNTLPKAYQWIIDQKENRKTINGLVEAALKYGNVSTLRRIGYLLESNSVKAALTRKLFKALPKSQSLIPWIPKRPSRGTINQKWGLIING